MSNILENIIRSFNVVIASNASSVVFIEFVAMTYC
jgi:hypothetical protein